MNDLETLRPHFDRLQRRALTVGVVGAGLLLIGASLSLQQFFQSYLFAYVFWVNFSLGCFAILMLHHLVSGGWGFVIQRIIESGARTLPLMALLFVPILFGLQTLYPWARPEVVYDNHILHHKSGYLNIPFFVLRTVIYFIFWISVAFLLSKWSRTQDHTAEPGLTRNMRLLSAPGLVFYVLTITFASVDWIMSLEPEWFSSIYGMLTVVGQALSTLALSIVAIRFLAEQKPFSNVLTVRHFHHLGNLLLAFTVLWAYMAFSQYLIIWSGNLPEENSWYLRRLGAGWNGIALFLVIAHFFVPFLLLLSRRTKRAIRMLSMIAFGIIVMRLIDLYWLITPAFNPDRIHLHWLDIVAPISIGGIWLAIFVWNLKGHPLLPLNDPRFAGFLKHAQS